MGEISFTYKTDNKPVYEAAFKYWFAESIEYSIAYQRYIALSDASIFNSPVAITKVAPGLYNLQELFAERINERDIESHKDYQASINRNGKVQKTNNYSLIKDNSNSTSKFKELLCEPFVFNFSIQEFNKTNLMAFLNSKPYLNRYKNINAITFEKEMNIIKNTSLSLIDIKDFCLYNNLWAYIDNDKINITNDIFINIDNKSLNIFNHKALIRDRISFKQLPDFDSIIRDRIPIRHINILFNKLTGVIIPISRVKNQSYIDNINTMVYRIIKEGFLNYKSTSSVLAKNKNIKDFNELMCDRTEHNVYIDYKNTQIAKTKLYALINSQRVSAFKKSNLAFTDNQLFGRKNIINVWIEQNIVNTFKKNKNVFIKDNINIIKERLKLNDIQSPLFIDNLGKMCYYDYGFTWLEKETIDSQIQMQFQAYKNHSDIHMLDCISPIVKKELNAFYDCGIFANKDISESNLFNQMSRINQESKEVYMLPNDFSNWAWVYETPNPFETSTYGIDELLLPENDTRYEDFENIIFDTKNMRPKNPVKQIDDTTFIAKYPIRHPIPKYNDIAISYDKSAIKIEQFYGIETSIMQEVFLKYYRIWQSKIFEFGTMTMTQAVNKMLEYLYAWIMVHFPPEKIEQALRVFKLIRWYGETSIIKNSQYIISYEYETLESKLNTEKCLIPNDLDTNDTMYIDSSLGVIRNNPKYIKQDVHVTFEIDNRKNTMFIFSLSNTIGSVNIYINDELVDTVSKSALNLTYPIPYTGDINIVKIEKTAINNLNETFFIGNIKVPNGTFKNLSIEFDPILKAGNKPLNEIAKKIIDYANLFDDKENLHNFIQKGNLGISEIYDKLTEYWKIHHQDKTKGKRLTIKEV